MATCVPPSTGPWSSVISARTGAEPSVGEVKMTSAAFLTMSRKVFSR
jgi:hypothetical protein